MDSVSTHDLAAILETVHRLNEATDPHGFPSVATAALGTIITSDIVSYNEVDPSVPRIVAHVDPEDAWVEQLHGTRWAKYSGQHPMLAHFLRTGDGSARRISDFCTRSEYHELDLYRFVYRDLRAEYQLSCTLPAPDPLVIALALSREDRDYSERDRAVLNLLRPHLIQAHWNARVRARTRAALLGMQQALEEGGWGVALAANGSIDALTPDVSTWTSRYVDHAVLDAWLASERAASDAGVLPRPLVSSRAGRRLITRMTRGVDGPDVLVFAEGPADDDSTPLQSLGLGPREAEVLFLTSRGLRNAEIAASLAVSLSTVKRHLEHIYLKLGVHNRTEAAARAFEVFATRVP